MTSFDLFRNPFVLLGVDLTASAQEITDAFEDALSERRYSEADLTAARQALLRPVLRLPAEISSLLDTPSHEWRAILTTLRHSQANPDFRGALAKAGTLSWSNILAQVASRTPSDASKLSAWINIQSSIKSDVVYSELQRLRKTAGIAPPEREAITAALNELREQQARALFDGFASPNDSIESVTTCTKNIISGGNDENTKVLTSLLNAYHRFIDQELSFRQERIKAAATELRSEPDGPGNLPVLIDAVKFWNAAAKPLQLLEAHKGRSESSSQVVFQEIRSVAVDLANERSRFDVALSLTNACQAEFANLPRAIEQLAGDESTLKDRISAAKIEPLATELKKLNNQLDTLAVDLRLGFSNSSSGLLKSLRNTFIAVTRDSKGSVAEDLPWHMLRSIAVKLNNECKDPTAALALVEGLLQLSRELGVSEQIMEHLTEDKRAVKRNQLENDLVSHLKANRYREALSAIENLLTDYKSPEERDTLRNLKSQVEGKRTVQHLRRGFWAAVTVGVGVYIVANMDQSPRPASQASPYAYPQPAAPTRVRSLTEEIPPIGIGTEFSQANIRYCQFQKARLEFIEPHVFNNTQVDGFNRLVDDYNSRCSSFRYRQSDWSAVQSDLVEKRAELEAQAQRIIDGLGAER
jgi:hypothetical protein